MRVCIFLRICKICKLKGLSRQIKGFKWRYNHINLDCDYPPTIIAKRREYAEIQRVLKENQVKFQTVFPARLCMFFNDGTKIYESPAEATEDLVKRGYVIKTTPAPTAVSLMERIKLLSWTRVDRRASRAVPDTSRGLGYKEKLRTFWRSMASANAD